MNRHEGIGHDYGLLGCSVAHLVSAIKQLPRHNEAQGFGSFEINRQLVLSWRLHGKIARVCSA
jgi:hypothetical protein